MTDWVEIARMVLDQNMRISMVTHLTGKSAATVRRYLDKYTDLQMTTTLTGYDLELVTEENDRGSKDVFIEDDRGNTASYECAVNEGYLTANKYPWEDRKLTQKQLNWLNSQRVADWMDVQGY